jgi:hypothetical protein
MESAVPSLFKRRANPFRRIRSRIAISPFLEQSASKGSGLFPGLLAHPAIVLRFYILRMSFARR